ncbi:hypothetical protein [Rathayibacter sp. VKM Ac-2801]|uniref:hypothetical protein n=1 Tax=Rathayibacter sp. VKM Ac-2801 TaxID=2609255 RepID=UPI0013203D43|nr:hypothetical protein [Rathayibacter sp. VKM Ac-2801]QHC71040.1 hypothetical protein GSU45_12100 [Rathayibacter sp. VKM Ac-2801]
MWIVHRALILDNEQWRVAVYRTEDEAEWKVELEVNDECDGDTAAALAIALGTAADEARRLNLARAVVSA